MKPFDLFIILLVISVYIISENIKPVEKFHIVTNQTVEKKFNSLNSIISNKFNSVTNAIFGAMQNMPSAEDIRESVDFRKRLCYESKHFNGPGKRGVDCRKNLNILSRILNIENMLFYDKDEMNKTTEEEYEEDYDRYIIEKNEKNVTTEEEYGGE
jgi:hypothetical protein